MLFEDARTIASLRKIVSGFSTDPVLQEDLMQECLIRLWRFESERPGRTPSWYLQNCRYHLQHWLAAGRSVDSLKRASGNNRIPIDGVDDELPADWYHTNGELFELVSAHDIVLTLANHLNPREQDVLDGLADGLLLRDIASRAKLSYPTVLKYRRKIAALTIKLEIAVPPRKRERSRLGQRVNGVCHRDAGTQTNGNKKLNPLPNILRAQGTIESKLNGHTSGTFRTVSLQKEADFGGIPTKYKGDLPQREHA